MDAKAVVQEFWANSNRGDLDKTWQTYVAEDIIIHPPGGGELGRGS